MYTVTIIIKRNNFHFSITMKSEKVYDETLMKNSLINIGALGENDEIMNVCFMSDETITSLDKLIVKHGNK